MLVLMTDCTDCTNHDCSKDAIALSEEIVNEGLTNIEYALVRVDSAEEAGVFSAVRANTLKAIIYENADRRRLAAYYAGKAIASEAGHAVTTSADSNLHCKARWILGDCAYADGKYGKSLALSKEILAFVGDGKMPKDIEMSSFWLARRYVIEEIKNYRGNDAFIQLLFARTTRNMADIEVEHFEREVGQSNYTFRKGLKLFMSFMNYSTIPLKISTVFGVAFSLTGFVAALVVLLRKLMDPTIQVGWSSLMCIILIVSGICFLMMGVIGEYIGKLIMTINRTPLYVVRETLNIAEGEGGQTIKLKDEEKTLEDSKNN